MIAKKAGEKYYCNPWLCSNGHASPRRVVDTKCMECDRIRATGRYARFTDADFQRKRLNERKYTSAHRQQNLARHKDYYARTREQQAAIGRANKTKRRAYLVHRMYGITAEQYAVLVSKQDGKCAICRTPLDQISGRGKQPHVDHCHETGRVRGILCTKCNAGIGMLRDDATLLRSAADYIDRDGV